MSCVNNVICTIWKGKSMRRYIVATVMSLTLLSSISAASAEDSTTINTTSTPTAAADTIAADSATTSTDAAPTVIAIDATTSTTPGKIQAGADRLLAPSEKSAAPKEPKAVKEPKTTKSSTSSGDGGIGAVPGRMASFAVGTMVGIPVSMFRKSKEESANATKDLVGDTDNKFLIAPAGLLGVPAGILSGTMQGIVFGIKNAWTGSRDEPFSREAFSLGDSGK